MREAQKRVRLAWAALRGDPDVVLLHRISVVVDRWETFEPPTEP